MKREPLDFGRYAMTRQYRITIREQPTLEFESWFEGLRVSKNAEDETILEFEVSDQAELVSVLTRLHYLNLTLLSVIPSENSNCDCKASKNK